MIVKQAGDIRIHTFVASFTYDNLANATHIIESKKKLVVIDAQFLVPYAKKFRDYANGLNKPIDRVYLSHRHPDHWFGLAPGFSDTDIYALQETMDYFKPLPGQATSQAEAARQDHLPKMGDLAPDTVLVPQNTVTTPSEDTIDGVKYRFDKVVDAEIDFLLTISLPEVGVYIALFQVSSG
jgi:glyoxylase-like metal-dependent hydrolase (beta-lactamase superfamily II)